MSSIGGMKKEVYAYGTHAGSTSETHIPLYVDGSTTPVDYYTVKQGFKLKIYELDGFSEQDTSLWIEVSTDGSTWQKVKALFIPSGTGLSRSWRMPFIINALQDLRVRFVFIQATGGAVHISWHGEVEEL